MSGLEGLLLNCSLLLLIEVNFNWGKHWGLDKAEIGVVCEATEKPDEGLFELVVTLGRDVIVLQVLLSVEGNLLGLNLAVFNIDLVTNQDNWDVLANTS